MKNKLLILSAIFMLFVACKTEKEIKKNKSATETEVSMADIVGTYHGVLPCASCPGIDTEIQLTEDGNYQSYEVFLDEDIAMKNRGIYKYDKKNNVIKLYPEDNEELTHQFAFVDDRIVKLTKRGKFVKGELAEMYELRKIASVDLLLNRYWKLSMINGKSIPENPMPKKEAHIVFKHDETMHGNSGCNNFGGGFLVKSDGKIEFSNVFSTRMACIDIDYEKDFLSALNEAAAYRITDSVLLIFNDDHSKHLTFVETENPKVD